MASSGALRPRLVRSSSTPRQAASLSPPMFLTASSTFCPSRRTPSTTSSEIDVAFLSSRTLTTVPSLGSGDPTRTICSTLIAQAFHSVPYPILPRIERIPEQQGVESAYTRDEILHIRHHSLFAPRDFDLSPYFQIVKPMIGIAFDPHKLTWADRQDHRISAQPVVGLAGRVPLTR